MVLGEKHGTNYLPYTMKKTNLVEVKLRLTLYCISMK